MLEVRLKYSVCDLICDVISLCLKCVMGKINVYDKIMIENQKKRKCGNQRHFYINLHLIDGLGMEFTAC